MTSSLLTNRPLTSLLFYMTQVTEECGLVTAKRLHVSEKSWAKLANHFTILLSDRDTDLLTLIQGHVERWRDGVEDFNIALRQREEEMKESLKSLKGNIEKWILDFQKNCLLVAHRAHDNDFNDDDGDSDNDFNDDDCDSDNDFDDDDGDSDNDDYSH